MVLLGSTLVEAISIDQSQTQLVDLNANMSISNVLRSYENMKIDLSMDVCENTRVFYANESLLG